jgi:hypothetical protein
MIWLTLLAIVTLQASPPVQSKKPVVQNSKTSAVGSASQQPVQNKVPLSSAVSHPDSEENTKQEGTASQTPPNNGIYKVDVVSQPNQPHDPWFIASVIATLLLVLAAGGTLRVLWRQTNEIAEQVALMKEAATQTNRLIEQAQKSADAAFLNAQAIVNAERAWIHITLAMHSISLYSINVTNHGKTPARILDYQFSIKSLPADMGISPENLAGPLSEVAINTFIGASAEKTLGSLEVWKQFGEFQEEIRVGHQIGIFQVIVRYKHIVIDDETCESRAVYRFNSDLTYDKLPTYTSYK